MPLPVRAVEGVGDLDPVAQHVWSSGSGPSPRRDCSVSPSTSSITRKSIPSSRPTSKSAQMCGCESCEMVFASRSKRRRASSVGIESRGQDLERHQAIEARVARLVDLAHASGSEGASTS